MGQSNQRASTTTARKPSRTGGSRRPRRPAEADGVVETVCQAQGMLMERHVLTPQAAMVLLRQCADNTGTTVQAVARALVATRQPS